MPKPHSTIPAQEAADAKETSGRHSTHESVAPGTRRSFTASEKLRLVKAADEAVASGVKGALAALLRKEGIYRSHLTTWRRQLGAEGEAGLVSRTPGRKPKLDAKDKQLLAAKKAITALEKKLRIADAVIALQKKAHEVLGLALPALPEDES